MLSLNLISINPNESSKLIRLNKGVKELHIM